MPSRQQPFLLSATVDLPDDVRAGVYTHALLDQMMSRLKSVGVRRIYWLYYGDIDPASFWAGNLFDYMEYGRRTIEEIGEPLKAAVPHAHRHGLEIYGVLKPFNTGLAGTYPEGSPEADAGGITRIGGTLQQVIPFTERHPETRIQRRPHESPSDHLSQSIRRICLYKRDDSPTRITRDHIQVWTSPHNYRYQLYPGPLSFSDRIEPSPREVRDYYGNLVTALGEPVRVLTLEGLDLADRYVAVTTDFKDEEGDFKNTTVGMIRAYGSDPTPLPGVVASRSAMWICPRDFRTGGLEFDSGYGPYEVELDTDSSSCEGGAWWKARGGCIAFARGKNEYLACTPCEAYPQVQKLWLGWVDRLLEAGVDGVDLRISAHGSLTDEPWNYGFNQPIVEEFRERFGVDPSGTGSVQEQLAQLRGEHYTAFFREASRRVRAAGKRLQAHVHTEAFRPDACHGQVMGFPANLHFDWQSWLSEGLVDSITLRTSWFEGLEDPIESKPERSRLDPALQDAVVEEAFGLAGSLDLPVHLNRYIGRAVGIDEYLNDLETVFHDPRFAGFDLYELADLALPTPDGKRLEPTGNWLEKIRAKTAQLGII